VLTAVSVATSEVVAEAESEVEMVPVNAAAADALVDADSLVVSVPVNEVDVAVLFEADSLAVSTPVRADAVDSVVDVDGSDWISGGNSYKTPDVNPICALGSNAKLVAAGQFVPVYSRSINNDPPTDRRIKSDLYRPSPSKYALVLLVSQ